MNRNVAVSDGHRGNTNTTSGGETPRAMPGTAVHLQSSMTTSPRLLGFASHTATSYGWGQPVALGPQRPAEIPQADTAARPRWELQLTAGSPLFSAGCIAPGSGGWSEPSQSIEASRLGVVSPWGLEGVSGALWEWGNQWVTDRNTWSSLAVWIREWMKIIFLYIVDLVTKS